MLSSFGNQRRTLPSCTHKSCCCPVGCASLENAPVPRCFPISSHHVFFPESRCRQHKRSGRRRATSRSEPQPRSSCCTEPSPTASSPHHLTPPVCHDSGTQVGDLVPSKSRSSRSRISCRNKKADLSLSPPPCSLLFIRLLLGAAFASFGGLGSRSLLLTFCLLGRVWLRPSALGCPDWLLLLLAAILPLFRPAKQSTNSSMTLHLCDPKQAAT